MHARISGAPLAKVRAEDIPAARRIAAFVFLMVADFFYGWS